MPCVNYVPTGRAAVGERAQGGLPVPAGQGVRHQVRHGRQGHTVWAPQRRLQALAYVEV